MSYNFLRGARLISNSLLCVHDNSDGFTSVFSQNGDFDGWDTYANIHLYGSWAGVLFGTSDTTNCYISRQNVFTAVPADNYYYVNIMMKITRNNEEVGRPTLTTGRLQWLTVNDNIWDSEKQLDFDINTDNEWHLHTINMGPSSEWVGDINNLRIYPFIDALGQGDQFAIKFIRISSLNTFRCDNTQCSYYLQYEHPCPGAGIRGACEAGVSKDVYTTVSGESDEFTVNIDGYGDSTFNLGDNRNLSGIEMSRVIADRVSSLNIGGYSYSICEYSELDKLKITSGTSDTGSSVIISGNAAEALGFYDEDGDISDKTTGTETATGFDYASTRLLTFKEINRLIDGTTDAFAYIHSPNNFSVEGGRSDFNEIGTGMLLSDLTGDTYHRSFNNIGKTIVDYSHPINNNGRVKHVWVYGKATSNSKIKILRPKKDGRLKVIHSINLPVESGSYLYTARQIVYRVDVDLFVNKGDLIGIYNADIYVGTSKYTVPDATFVQINGQVSGTFDPGEPLSYGLAGLAVYLRGGIRQTRTILDIDLGDRVNIEEMNIYGQEESEYFEFNIASCLDVSWEVDLFNESHSHSYELVTTGLGYTDIHQNIAYGVDVLDDMITTADNGQQGNSYNSGANGMETFGDHAYFYVDGDAEWLYSHDCNGRTEYCWPRVPYRLTGYQSDPISFTLNFPEQYTAKIHKSIIYFKERNNFRKLALSYQLNRYDQTGNADDSNFRLIPEYSLIKLDGLPFFSDEDAAPVAYIYNNPMSGEPIYTGVNDDGEPNNPSNGEIVLSALATDWSIIEHNFDEVDCYGFRIYTNLHKSTKVTEMEVYSKIRTEPSLLDNVIMSFSDYGDTWVTKSFEKVSNNQIASFMGGAPRYIRLELDSATVFSLNEMHLSVGDQVRLNDCEDVVLLDEAQANTVNKSTAVELTNIYDKPFDLYVDIPKEVTDTDNIVFWSKLGSMDEIDVPEIGPPCKLFKMDDYEIRNDNFQCAINIPAYALKNLVHGKEAYEIIDLDFRNEYFGTLSSGASIDFCNSDVKSLRKTTLAIDTGSSARYWKIGFSKFDPPTAGIVATYLGDISGSSFIDSGPNNYHGTTYGNPSESVSNLVEGNLIHFDGNDDIELMTHAEASTFESEFTVSLFFMSTSTSDGSQNRVISRDRSDYFSILVNQAESSPQTMEFADNNGYHYFDVVQVNKLHHVVMQFDEPNNISRCYFDGSLLYEDLSWNGFTAESRPIALASNVEGTTSHSSQLVGYIGDVRFFDYLLSESEIDRLQYASVSVDSVVVYKDSERMDLDRIYVESTNNTSVQTNELVSDGLDIPLSYENEAIGFRLVDSADTITKIVLLHNSVQIREADVRTSANNTSNYFVTGSAEPDDYDNDYWYKYLAIDLEARHDIDIIRNYGSATNKIVINKATGVEYSNTDTSDIDSVVWDSTYNDARWARIKLLCGDGVTRCIRKLGIYPNIETAFALGGGYNCEWQSLGNIFSDYTKSINAAFGATTTGTYAINFYPENAVDGVSNEYAMDECWGFQEENNEDPYIDIDFGQTYLIDHVKIHHGYDLSDPAYMNNNFNFKVVNVSGTHDPGHEVYMTGDVVDAPGVFGNSLYFDGTTNYIEIPDSEDWNFRNEDFAIDFRVKFKSFNTADGFDTFLWRGGYANPDLSFHVDYRNSTGNMRFVWYNTASAGTAIEAPWSPVLNTWYSVAVTTTSGESIIFIDDNPIVSGTITFPNIVSEPLYIGSRSDSLERLFNGWVDELRISKGDSRGGDSFTPAIEPYSTGSGIDEFTKLMIHFDGDVGYPVFSTTGNDQFETNHYFEPSQARKIRLEITDYDYTRFFVENPDTGVSEAFDGSFIREIEIYTSIDSAYVDSETWPVVCMDLTDQFEVTGHSLVNKDPNDTATNWDNSEQFFRYSDNLFDNPQKVSFTKEGNYITAYESSDSSGNRITVSEYTFDENIYFDKGLYTIEWDAYYAEVENEISIRLDGVEVIDHFADVLGTGWISQFGTIDIPVSGFYTVKTIQHINPDSNWGARYPIIYRSSGLIKWAAVKRDTAENYSYDNNSSKYGEDYLTTIKVYGDTPYNPTEYHWWWDSSISALSNDHVFVKVGRRALKISYPNSSSIDTVAFIEGDHFGNDEFFSARDLLHFWLYIDDVTKLDTSIGDIIFGIFGRANDAYFRWDISSLILSSGWNNLRLKFLDADYVYPETPGYSLLSDFFDDNLDFRTTGRAFRSFQIRFRGQGQAFNMYVDDLKIERNLFDEDVKFGKGISLIEYDYLEIPLSSVNLERGSVEFWVKMATDTYGRGMFDDMKSRVFFTLVNNSNNIISLGIKSGSWFEPITGHIRKALHTFNAADTNVPFESFIDRGEIIHLAMTWSNTGEYLDNKDTMRFYINGVLVAASKFTWEVGDTKSTSIRLGGTNTQAAYNQDIYGDTIMDNVKIYNYCKTSFNNPNTNFYGVESANLPIIFEQVPAGESRTIYVRANKNEDFKQLNRVTSTLIIDWLTTV